jgi:hypothetical protein
VPALKAVQGGKGAYYPVARLLVGGLPPPSSTKAHVSMTFYAAVESDSGREEAVVGNFAFFPHDSGHSHGNASISFDLAQTLIDLGSAGVDAGSLDTLLIGLEVAGLEAYDSGLDAFSNVSVTLTCFQ